jgi:hypothetical protein
MVKRNQSDTRRQPSTFDGKTITLYEQIDTYKLRYIIDHHDDFHLHELFHANSGVQPTRDAQVTLLKKYLKKATNGKIKVVYKQTSTGLGRYGAKGSLSLQCIQRNVRHTICRDYYNDVDVVNAHPVFLDQYLTVHEVPHPCLKYYVEHRDDLFTDMMNSQNMTRDDVKKLILKIMNGGDVRQEDLQTYPNAVVRFWVEMKDIRAKVMEMEPDIVGIARRKKERNNESEWNLGGSVLNLVLCDIENRVLMTMHAYLTQLGYAVDVLVFDGLMVRKNLSKPLDDTTLAECSVYVAEQTGYKCALVVKPMNEHLEIPADELVPEKTYAITKEELELTHFKCIRESLFYIIQTIKFLTKRKDDMVTSYEHIQCEEGGFIKQYLVDERPSHSTLRVCGVFAPTTQNTFGHIQHVVWF